MLRRLPLIVAAVLATTGAGVALAATTRHLSATADLKTTSAKGLQFTQKGRVSTSLGPGTMTLTSTIRRGRVTAFFQVRIAGGTVRGKATGTVDVGQRLTYDGTARLTSGTGRYANASGDRLRYTGYAPLNGKSAHISIAGTVRY